ncbi:MAG: FAD-dependent oxidoreductase [Bacteroidales bacterium]
MNRRDFFNTSGMLALGGLAVGMLPSCSSPFSTKIRKDDVKQSYKTQLLVLGGGPAGVCAAISAARKGIKVMIVEGGSCLGGMATRGLVSPFMTCYDTTGEIMVVRGMFSEIVDKLVAVGGAIHPSHVRAGTPYTAWITTGHDHVTPFDPEPLKLILDRMCAESGVNVLFHSSFVQPIMKGHSITGALLFTKSGYESVEADVVIDATGDGDVAFRSGVPCEFGNEQTGRVQPSTLFFRINNVDSAKLEADVEANIGTFHRENGVSYRTLHWRVAQAEAAGEWDIARKSVNIYKCVKDDEWAVNCTRIKDVDATSSESLTAGEIEGRRQVSELMNFFHKYVPGCENATLMTTASTIGIRESRHIKGDYILSVDDITSGKVPEDSVLVASNSVDVHGRNGDNSTEYITVKDGRWYGVPFRCLLPTGIDNLIVAGRCLSATSDAAGAVRVMPPCMAMGQAAGTAAAIAIKGGTTPRNLSADDLRKSLLEQKVFLG